MSWCTLRWLAHRSIRLVNRLEPSGVILCKHQRSQLKSLQFSTQNDSERLVADPSECESSLDSSSNLMPYSEGRRVDRTETGQKEIFMLKPDSPPGAKILRVAIIGLPNSGKSTLTNALMGWRVCSVSNKVHTTKKNTMAVYTDGNTQIIFVDTPGVLRPGHRKRHKLDKSLEIDPVRSLATADLVIATTDMDYRRARRHMDPHVLQLLYMYSHIPSVLVLNKVDLVKNKQDILYSVKTLTDAVVGGKSLEQIKKSRNKKEDLFAAADERLGLANDHVPEEEDCPIPSELKREVDEDVKQGEITWEEYFNKLRHADKVVGKRRGWPLFEQVFSVSALRNLGVDELKEYLLDKAVPGAWQYHSSLVTDQPPQEVVLLSIRQALMDNLQNEVPYLLEMNIAHMEIDPEDDLLNLVVNIKCQSVRQLTIFLGRDGENIRKISSQAKQAIMNTFRCETRLRLVAKLKHKKK